LTPDGEVLAGYARRILKLQHEALGALRKPHLDSLVRIGMPDDYACFLGPVLTRLSQSHPLVRVEVICKPSDELHELMAEGQVDLSVTTRNYGETPIPGKIIRLEPLVWVSSAKHSVELEEPLPLAIYFNGGPFQKQAIAGLEALGRECRIAYASPNLTGLIATIESGLAVGIIGKLNTPKEAKVLGLKDGFPLLPYMEVELRSRPGAAVEILAEHFTEVLSQDSV
jgi:DNA-binding transcriptional LysR family regulator